ncbi:hypothetical protein JW960_09910 [candidate division KSB1 bacterium]|nr:hypothetical protein [candidate division KSB1 bacterium]
MSENNKKTDSHHVENDALIAAMQAAWTDHHHARDQTWKVLQMEAVLGAGLVTVDAQFGLPIATVVAAALVVISSIAGISITLRHRGLERRKFIHIMNCEEELGLHRDNIIPLTKAGCTDLNVDRDEYEQRCDRQPTVDVIASSAVGIPGHIKVLDIFKIWKANTSLFILRMHVAIAVFAIVLMLARIMTGSK